MQGPEVNKTDEEGGSGLKFNLVLVSVMNRNPTCNGVIPGPTHLKLTGSFKSSLSSSLLISRLSNIV